MQSASTKPSDEEVAKELRNFQGRLTLQPNLWTLADLKGDFKRLRGNDYSNVASIAAGTGQAVIKSLLQPHSVATNLLEKAREFLADKAKESITGHIVDISLQPLNEGESKATKELVTELGTTIIMGAVVGNIPLMVGGALFTIIIYLYKSEKERQKKSDDKLAEKLWETWEKIREKSQAKVDEMNETQIEDFLRRSWAQDKFDEGTVLKYQHEKHGVQSVKVRDCVTLLNIVGSKGPYNLPSQFHAAQAFSVFGIIPGEESGLEADKRTEVGKWLYQQVKAESEKKDTVVRRLMAGEEFEGIDIDEKSQVQPRNWGN